MLKRVSLLIFCLFLDKSIDLSIPSLAQADHCPGVETSVSSRAYEQITVSTTAVGLTPTGADRFAVVIVEDNPVRYRDDGTAPTSTVGALVKADQVIIVCGSAMSRFKAIRQGAADAKLSVTYYQG